MGGFFVRVLSALSLLIAVYAPVQAQWSDRELLRIYTPVVDVILTSPTSVRLYYQNFDAWDADAAKKGWTQHRPVIKADSTTYSIRRIGRVLHAGDLVIAGGHIISRSNGLSSAILRSTDDGQTFDVVKIGTDTLGSTDGLRMTSDGALIFLDRVGRFWSSGDKGLTWSLTKMPSPVPPAAAREVDMVNTKMGVCVDIERKIHFTTNGWQSVIAPMASARPIIRTQPTFLDYFNWNRELTFWNNELILIEGRDIYRTPSNDLLWQRWDSVVAFSMATDRSKIAFYTNTGRLYTASSLTEAPTLVAADVLRPQFIRLDDDAIICYRADTGPVIYRVGTATMIRPYDVNKPIGEPAFVARVKKKPVFGVVAAFPGAELVDLVRLGASGMWQRDTIADIGPVRSVHATHPDSVIINTAQGSLLYHLPSRKLTTWNIRQPLRDFLATPISRFRVIVAADELDSTHVQWTEFRLVNNVFRCAELVDSSKFGVRSTLVDLRITAEEVTKLLNNVNDRAGRKIGADELTMTDPIRQELSVILDTIFDSDAYFDTLDLYRPPPKPEIQIEDCKREFREAAEKMALLTPDQITAALMAWRRVPKDEFSRYELQFENRSGRFLKFTVENDDEAHLPLMCPWIGSVDGVEWLSYDRGLTKFFQTLMAPQALPPLFTIMSKDVWAFVAVGSYLDGLKTGRVHRWKSN